MIFLDKKIAWDFRWFIDFMTFTYGRLRIFLRLINLEIVFGENIIFAYVCVFNIVFFFLVIWVYLMWLVVLILVLDVRVGSLKGFSVLFGESIWRVLLVKGKKW